MRVRLTMLCATATEGSRDQVFGDGALSEHDRHELAAARAALPPYARAVRTPSVRCAQLAEALAVEATPESALRDLDYGAWDGRPLEEIAAEDPYGLSSWLTDPDAAPHGGESVRELCRRTATWLDMLRGDTGSVLAITESTVVRAALVHVLSAPARAFWHLDVPSFSAVTLTMRDGGWNARFGRLEVPQQRPPADGSPHVAVLTIRSTRRHMCLTSRP
ncbi:histidine phosphatase family protein [Streptomyces echinatus]|uniref:Broad specificity phosphatase PhoE n=1 Tax=Streptomyces echinatus TaxID=67293 RepID=A0A7W9PSB3_9ACTN|nr:histidine phosphatase family protein [Streptomyces echinatus]MBB5926784.1 broad specificity phosphatase PhoE [Streptomyces echinatus]